MYYATKNNSLFPMSQDWISFWSPVSLFSRTSGNMQDAIDRLYTLSVKQIQMAYDSGYDDLKNQYGGSSSSSIRFLTPHSVSSQSLGFGTIGAFKKHSYAEIEYWATGKNGRRSLIRVKGSLDFGNVENISIYWAHTGEYLDIPLGGFDNYQQYKTSKPPDIIEAEYRDIKKDE
ncbi:11174_t:CDS:1 [Acaulospora colombiana]|uniref:11174_t:CDS:1 n=1 Tax=Acaulospora colombiana TaxID=27376 RepID=A0ACA9P0D0_9GLOM|nr:11174_t:CDS:1 [Acaulospora colombiana]